MFFVKCRNLDLQNDREYYIEKLNAMFEIESVENLWITRENGYKQGTYLSTNIRFKTKFGDKWKHDRSFRTNVFERLLIKETCPRYQ